MLFLKFLPIVSAPSRHIRSITIALRHHGARHIFRVLTRCSYSSNFSQLFDLRHHGTSLDLRRHGALILPFAGIVHLFRVL